LGTQTLAVETTGYLWPAGILSFLPVKWKEWEIGWQRKGGAYYDARMADLSPELREALLREDWDLLYKQLLVFAQSQLNRLMWRGSKQGLLPDGHDANTIASDAIAQVYAGESKLLAAPYAPAELQDELKRPVTNQLHNLYRRKENLKVRNEFDLLPRAENGEQRSILESRAGDIPPADEEAMRKEGLAKLNAFREQFAKFLGEDQMLRDLFECIVVGILKREEIAEMLNVDPKVVTNARKRLDRRLADFAQAHPEYPKPFIQEMIDV
jgi:hypothetical protein